MKKMINTIQACYLVLNKNLISICLLLVHNQLQQLNNEDVSKIGLLSQNAFND